MWSNDIKCRYMFYVPSEKFARKGLRLEQNRHCIWFMNIIHFPCVDRIPRQELDGWVTEKLKNSWVHTEESNDLTWCPNYIYDIITLICFPHYTPFMYGIHHSPVDPMQIKYVQLINRVMSNFNNSVDAISINKLLSTQMHRMWFDLHWSSCDVTVMEMEQCCLN